MRIRVKSWQRWRLAVPSNPRLFHVRTVITTSSEVIPLDDSYKSATACRSLGFPAHEKRPNMPRTSDMPVCLSRGEDLTVADTLAIHVGQAQNILDRDRITTSFCIWSTWLDGSAVFLTCNVVLVVSAHFCKEGNETGTHFCIGLVSIHPILNIKGGNCYHDGWCCLV